MGGKGSKNKAVAGKGKEEKKQSEKVDEALSRDRAKDSEVIKLLLLGAGESGKSTLFKQLQVLYKDGFTARDLNLYVPRVHSNVIEAMKELVAQTSRLPGCELQSAEARAASEHVLRGMALDERVGPELASTIKVLWADPGVKHAYEQRAQFQLIDMAGYFFDEIDRIAAPGYVPTQNDVIRCRVRTTGIVESRFSIDNNNFLVVDVGGQRNERRKWIHCFEDVTAVLFVVALSEYNQTLFEDNATNRMDEALTLFREMAHSHVFSHTSFVLFLNKVDLFVEKLKTTPVSAWHPEAFPGNKDPSNPEDAVAYIRGKFVEAYGRAELYVHVTCATDSNMVQHVFSAVKDIVIQQHLARSGLI